MATARESAETEVQLTVNGKAVVLLVHPMERLLDVLRQELT
jgi:aerobic-type carbon monoxide dehydrogenase small subunit (CoxS/CutS family)